MRKFMLVAVVVLSLVAMPATALADKPAVFEYEDISDTSILAHCDAIDGGQAFDIRMDRLFDVRQTLFFDKDGKVIRVVNTFDWKVWSLTNTVTGKTLHNNPNAIEVIDLVAMTYALVGRVWSLTIPGEGVVVLGTGIIIYDLTQGTPGNWPILFQGGPHPIYHEISPEEAFCPWLAGS